MSERFWLVGLLICLGIGWGFTQPLAKIAVSTGHAPLGLVFWQLVVSGVLLSAVIAAKGGWPRITRLRVLVWVVIALIGTVLPNSASYQAAIHLPAGVISILLSLIPMLAFGVALVMALERFRWTRFAGLLIGLCGVLLLVLPEASLPDRAMIAYLPLALIAPVFYAVEGNVVAKWGTAGMDAVEVLAGASWFGAVISLPVILTTGAWVDPRSPWGLPEGALLLSAAIHAVVYTTYIWLVGRAGAVFAVQVSYLVTGAGVIWAMLLLGERYSGWVWAAMALMFAGLALVQPRPKITA